jgi:hypothetical protein
VFEVRGKISFLSAISYLDTCIVIYVVERHPLYSASALIIVSATLAREAARHMAFEN